MFYGCRACRFSVSSYQWCSTPFSGPGCRRAVLVAGIERAVKYGTDHDVTSFQKSCECQGFQAEAEALTLKPSAYFFGSLPSHTTPSIILLLRITSLGTFTLAAVAAWR